MFSTQNERSSVVRRRVTAGTVGVVTLATVAVGVGIATKADASPSAASSAAFTTTERAGATAAESVRHPIVHRANHPRLRHPIINNARLRHDLYVAVRLPADQVPAALDKIRDDALAGVYGPRVERRAERLAAWFHHLPQSLQDDVVGLRTLPVDQREDAWSAIVDNAFAGEYGGRMQALAERAHARFPAWPR